jgi:ankyrin repeat protein
MASKISSQSSCLVARAVPGSLPPSNDNALMTADALADSLRKLTVHNSPTTTTVAKKSSRSDTITPADFVTLQSLRSSALAKKTNTTSKFGRDSANLFADLLLTNDEEPEKVEKETEKKTEKQKSDEKTDEKKLADDKETDKEEVAEEKDKKTGDDKNADLLSRGPVYATRAPVSFHPYENRGGYYGAALQTAVEDPTSYSSLYDVGYECGVHNYWNNSRELLSASSTPDTINTDGGYSSATSPPQQSGSSYGGSPAMTSVEVNRLLSSNNKSDNEAPDALCDFILKYSRRYAQHNAGAHAGQSHSRRSSLSDDSGWNDASPKTDNRPPSAGGLCQSPLSAVSAPQSSPAGPHGAISGPHTPTNMQFQSRTGQYKAQLRQTGGEQMVRPAKERLRSMIRDEDMDEAWAWTCKCIQYFPGALSYQDTDRDTLLHIVTQHMDLAKIYALVEQMIKTVSCTSSRKPFDTPNRHGETPLFLAVEKRQNEIVDYLLEAGAYPNAQTLRPERDAPLHHAAARGMTSIVQTMCSYATTNVNALNGMGLTALLCAVKNHGVLEEESQQLINNRQTIQVLLQFGADPLIADATNGKTIIHYAVERMNPELIEILHASMDEETMTSLVNKADLCLETPLDTVQALINADEQMRSRLCLTLISSGASAENRPNYASGY